MNRVSKILQTKYPLIQAPMSWLTDAKIVAAVSNSGGMGVLGPNAGRSEIIHGPKNISESMRKEIIKVKQLTSNSFGININTPDPRELLSENKYVSELLKVAFEEEVKFFVVVGSVHKELFDLIKKNNGVIIFRPLTPTIEQFKLAEKYGASIVVATGYDEGGVLPEHSFGTFTVIPNTVDEVSIPVMGAGGINDKRGVNAAFDLGAEGIYIGSRFLVTKESPMNLKAKQMIIESDSSDLISVSKTQRSIKTKKALQLANSKFDVAMNLRPAMRLGEIDQGIITVNTGLATIKQLLSVKKLIKNLMEDFEDVS